MTVTDFLLPVFVLVLLTYVLHFLMARERIASPLTLFLIWLVFAAKILTSA